MKKTLEQFRFEYLPTRTEFDDALEELYGVMREPDEDQLSWYLSVQYKNLVKQKPELWMFVPCDEEGKPMEVPLSMDYMPLEGHPTKYPQECYEGDLNEYHKAKDGVMFEGWELMHKHDESNVVTSSTCLFHCFSNGTVKAGTVITKTYKEVKTIEQAINQGVKLKYRGE